MYEVYLVILLPFLGTVLGSAMVYLLKDKLNERKRNKII